MKKRVCAVITGVAIIGTVFAGSPPGVSAAAPADTVYRLAGPDRYATNLAIAKAGWSSSDAVCIATGADFPDALSGSAMAGALDCPMLLVSGADASAACGEVKALRAAKAYIFGGTGAVPRGVESQLKAAGIASIVRYGGLDRYSTAAQVALAVADIGKDKGKPADTVVIASGANFPDALSVAPIAGMEGYPVVLTDPASLPAAAADALGRIKPALVIIAGGIGAVSRAVQDTIAAKYTGNILRLGGADRYATSAAIAAQFAALFAGKQCFACGANFPDALGGAAYAARIRAPILLLDAAAYPESARRYIKAHGSGNVADAVVFGGAGVLPAGPVEEAYGQIPGEYPQVADLSAAQGADKLIVVTDVSGYTGEMTTYEKVAGDWRVGWSVPAYVGKNGVSYDRTEGDKTTPGGAFALDTPFGNAPDPGKVPMGYRKVTAYDWWVGDPGSPRYNQWVHTASPDFDTAKSERLIDYPRQYQYAIPIKFNWPPNTDRGKGSAIFLHCGGSYTLGCVAVDSARMLQLLRWIGQSTVIVIAKNRSDLQKF